MSLVLNTNYSSLVAQGSLSTSGSQLSTALQQLSSGLRINTAADDAAGYAIVQGMTSQINGLNQAARNANDGVSLAQTAQGALTEITNDLQSMRDLAVQSLNATNSTQDRADLNQQFAQLQADINNVASTASFNGVNLLDGTFQGATFQVGANVGQTITVSSVASANTSALGTLYTAAGPTTAAAMTAGQTGSLTITTTPTGGSAMTAVSTGSFTVTGNVAADLKTVAAAINAVSGQDGGIIATVNATGNGISLSSTTSSSVAVAAGGSNGASVTLANIGINAANTVTAAGTTTNLNVGAVTSVDASNLALAQIDAALQQVAATGAQLGAYQNRFQSAIQGLNTDSTNLQSARSQIQDTDYAAATSQLSKAQILQQASTAMVAQANMIPQNILTLLQKLP
ncbi:MAG TPA: flagellin [Steroidobacteraceae bacterium]|nr:flagellin [Steroidobacteraceae bacterium]